MFRDLKAFVSKNLEQQQLKQEDIRLQRLKGLPFWLWDISEEEHKQLAIKTNGRCCFTDMIGRPSKNNVEMPMFPYEELIYNTLQSNKLLYILKSSGLGVSEYFLRYIAWMCLRNDDFRNSQVCIVTGPNINLSVKLIRRLKALFEPKLNITFNTKETVVELNSCTLEAFPSNHLSAMRSLTNPKLIYIDECAFFHPQEMNEVRDVAERYLAKSSPYIILVSTPNRPGDLMQQISQEPEETCIYRRLYLDYSYGLGYIYSQQEIDEAKKSGSFSREYDLKFLGEIGNVYHTKDIDASIELGKKYSPENFSPFHFATTAMGLDPAYGSSAFGIVITQFADGIIQILYASEFYKPDFNVMLDTVHGLMSKYGVLKVYVDGANPSFIRSLKLRIGEDAEYEKAIQTAKQDGYGDGTNNMKIVPVNFSTSHKSMLGHTKMILEQEPKVLAINPVFDKLIVSLRTAVANDAVLDKEATSHADIFDAFRLALKFYRFEGR
jgi:hypothetical protein